MARSDINAVAFVRGLRLADSRVRKAARRGVAIELAKAEHRGKERCPIKTGTLSASITADIQGIQETADSITGTLTAGGGEAADYAVRQHEEPLHHTFPVDGVYASKFVEMPLREAMQSLPITVADECRRALSGGAA